MTAARSINSRARFVITSPQVDWDAYMEANRAGAFHVMSMPDRPKEVEWVIVQAKRKDRQMVKQLLNSDPTDRVRRTNESA